MYTYNCFSDPVGPFVRATTTATVHPSEDLWWTESWGGLGRGLLRW